MKTCSTCKIEKPFEEFSKNKTKKDGYQNVCKACIKLNTIKTKEQRSKRAKQYYLDNKEDILLYQKEYRGNPDNKEKISKRRKLHYEENKESIIESRKEYCKKYREENREELRKKNREYKSQNKDVVNANTARRFARKLKATPQWLTEEQHQEILDFYTICQMFQIYTGLQYNVDHIVPLRGKDVCGLHVPWNLQVLEASENQSKGNKLLEEYL